MTTVYIVSNREYSDGGTLAVFSTRENADNYVEIYNRNPNKWSEACTEEYELDEGMTQLLKVGKTLYKFAVYTDSRGNKPLEITSKVYTMNDEEWRSFNPTTHAFVCSFTADTQEQANKIVYDWLAQEIAKVAGVA